MKYNLAPNGGGLAEVVPIFTDRDGSRITQLPENVVRANYPYGEDHLARIIYLPDSIGAEADTNRLTDIAAYLLNHLGYSLHQPVVKHAGNNFIGGRVGD